MPQDIKLTSSTKHIMLLAGESSGDKHGAKMAQELLSINPELKISAMGGQHMKRAGISVFFDSSSIAVMGIVEVLKRWGDIKSAMALVKTQIEREKPDLLVCIDYQEFNQKIAAFAKSLGIKVLFYISPQVWAWRPKRVKKIGKIIDHMAVIFPFEVEFYTKHNVPVTYVGHPLVDKVPAFSEVKTLTELSNEKLTIGLFPGSRQSELERLLPTMLESALKLKADYGESIQFVLPVADTLDSDNIKEMLKHYDLAVVLVPNNLYSVIKSCDAIISCSGTVTLEIALLGVPLCVIYKLSWLSHQIMSRMMIIDHFSLVNIVAKREVVKEMMQKQANPHNISHEIAHILEDKSYALGMKQGLSEIKKSLGEGGGSRNIARLALELLEQ